MPALAFPATLWRSGAQSGEPSFRLPACLRWCSARSCASFRQPCDAQEPIHGSHHCQYTHARAECGRVPALFCFITNPVTLRSPFMGATVPVTRVRALRWARACASLFQQPCDVQEPSEGSHPFRSPACLRRVWRVLALVRQPCGAQEPTHGSYRRAHPRAHAKCRRVPALFLFPATL